MADNFAFKTEGFKELEALLVEMGEDFCYSRTASKVLLPAVKTAMQSVYAQAHAMIPYDESNKDGAHMRDSMKISARQPNKKDRSSAYVDPNDVALGEVFIKTDKRGVSQEFGNDRTSPQPFLRIALESQAQTVVNTLGSFLAYKLNQYKSTKV